MKIEITHYTNTGPDRFHSDLVVTVERDIPVPGTYYRPHGITTDTASGETGPVTDTRWFAQPSGKPANFDTQRWLDERILVSYVEHEEN